MPTQSLPAASLSTANRFPAARMLLCAINYLIYKALSSVIPVIFAAESNFLPALREATGRRSLRDPDGAVPYPAPSTCEAIGWPPRTRLRYGRWGSGRDGRILRDG
jgi:hypothetical protein